MKQREIRVVYNDVTATWNVSVTFVDELTTDEEGSIKNEIMRASVNDYIDMGQALNDTQRLAELFEEISNK